MMQIGDPEDKRRFKKKPVGDGVTADITVDATPLPTCDCCGMTITGKYFRVGEGKYECQRCFHE